MSKCFTCTLGLAVVISFGFYYYTNIFSSDKSYYNTHIKEEFEKTKNFLNISLYSVVKNISSLEKNFSSLEREMSFAQEKIKKLSNNFTHLTGRLEKQEERFSNFLLRLEEQEKLLKEQIAHCKAHKQV